MLKRYTFWMSAAVIFQLITGVIHCLSLFITPVPENATETQMMDLINTHHMDMGGGFHPTFANLFTALSSCFTLLCLFAALTNGYLLFKHIEPTVMRGIIGINVIIFGTAFLMMAVFTFLPPILCTGLILINLIAAFIVVPRIESAV